METPLRNHDKVIAVGSNELPCSKVCTICKRQKSPKRLLAIIRDASLAFGGKKSSPDDEDTQISAPSTTASQSRYAVQPPPQQVVHWERQPSVRANMMQPRNDRRANKSNRNRRGPSTSSSSSSSMSSRITGDSSSSSSSSESSTDPSFSNEGDAMASALPELPFHHQEQAVPYPRNRPVNTGKSVAGDLSVSLHLASTIPEGNESEDQLQKSIKMLTDSDGNMGENTRDVIQMLHTDKKSLQNDLSTCKNHVILLKKQVDDLSEGKDLMKQLASWQD